MHITLDRLDDAFHFRAANNSGRTVDIDGPDTLGGSNKGVRPMQLMLMSLGGCSGVDVVNMLKKQHQLVVGLRISIDGERQQDKVPSLFENIQLHFQFEGDLDPVKLKRAVELSLDKYCSAAATLAQSAELSHRVSLNGESLE